MQNKFGELEKKKQKRILSRDKELNLINDIISANETYFYDVSNIDKSRNRTTFEYYERDVTKKNMILFQIIL